MGGARNRRSGTRYEIPPSVLDENGYIIDQGHLESVPFGWFSSRRNGCGWIAAYNLLKMHEMEEPAARIIHELERCGMPGKPFGEEVVWLLVYLHRKGFAVHLSRPGIRGCEETAGRYSTGILMYMHRRGAHYAAYRTVDGGRVQLYNAIYRKKEHVVTIREFLEEHSVLHGAIVIGCRPRTVRVHRCRTGVREKGDASGKANGKANGYTGRTAQQGRKD